MSYSLLSCLLSPGMFASNWSHMGDLSIFGTERLRWSKVSSFAHGMRNELLTGSRQA